MRERLISATLSLYLNRRERGPAIAEDVIKAAGVSRGTFYKYFNSVDEAVSAVGQRLADQAVRELIAAVPDKKVGPLAAAPLGAQMLMCRSARQPGWGDLVSRSGHPRKDAAYGAA